MNRQVNIARLKEKEDTIAELVELIIPETDTPGAKRARVHQYLIGVMTNCKNARQRNIFIDGLDNLEKRSLVKYDSTFIECSTVEKTEILAYFAANSVYSIRILNKINNKFFGGSFFNTLKNLTIEGYCTSMLGATKGLAYDYIPGTFVPCIPFKAGQKSWATK